MQLTEAQLQSIKEHSRDMASYHAILNALNISDDPGSIDQQVQPDTAETSQSKGFGPGTLYKDIYIYRLLIEHLPDMGLLIFDRDMRFIVAGGPFLNRMGYERDKVEGKTLNEVLHEDKVQQLMPIYEAVLGGQFTIFEQTIEDGVVYQAQFIPLYDEDAFVIGGMILAQDITTFRNIEKRLKKNQHLLNETANLAGIGGWEFDFKTSKLTWTQETYHIHDIDPADEVPNIDDAIDFYAPEARPIITEAFDALVREGKSYDLELPFVTAKGRNIWVRAVGKALFDGDKLTHVYGVFQDITHQRAMKEHELRLQRERMQLLSQFVRDTSHQFLNPLTVITSAAGLIDRSRQDDDYVRKKIVQILSESERISQLLEQMRILSQLENEDSLRMGEGNFNLTIQEAIYSLRDLIAQKQLSLVHQLDEKLPPVVFDVDMIYQSVINIVRNAAQHTPSGGTITVVTENTGNCVRLTVHDTGVGMSAETIDKVFDVFYRADASRTQTGFGLGLTIVRRAIERHEGRIHIESTLGEGTTVRIELPFRPRQTEVKRVSSQYQSGSMMKIG